MRPLNRMSQTLKQQQYENSQFIDNGDDAAPQEWNDAKEFVGEPTGYIFISRKARNSAIKYGAAAAVTAGGVAATIATAGAGAGILGAIYGTVYGGYGAGITAFTENSANDRRRIKYTFKKEKDG